MKREASELRMVLSLGRRLGGFSVCCAGSSEGAECCFLGTGVDWTDSCSEEGLRFNGLIVVVVVIGVVTESLFGELLAWAAVRL